MTSTGIESTVLEARAQTFAALSDPIRLQVLDILGAGSRCACDLRDAVGIAPNLLSYHLRVLREAGLVDASRRGRWVDYRLSHTGADLVSDATPAGLARGTDT
ncbi:MAG: metalloregulator ArsR/SmtB family transcription factor [Acidimicrobiia bacterium]